MTPAADVAFGHSIPLAMWLIYGVLFVFWAVTTALLGRVVKNHDEQQKSTKDALEAHKEATSKEMKDHKEVDATLLQKLRDDMYRLSEEHHRSQAAIVERLHAIELATAQSATRDSLMRLENRLEQLHGDMRALAVEMRSSDRHRRDTIPPGQS